MEHSDDERSSLLDPETLRQVFKQLEATDVDELEVQVGSSRLFLRRDPGGTEGRIRAGVSDPDGRPAGVPIAAPVTGVFYSRPTPDQAPYVSVGDPVEIGQVVALIETMKLFNEVISDIAGDVVSLHVRDGDLIEVGQALMHIEPPDDGRESGSEYLDASGP